MHSPCMSLRGNIVTVAISCLLFVLVACGDDDSDFATRPSDGSSSSGKEIATNSSSSRNDKSSSSSEYTRVPCDVETDENCFEDARDGQTYKTVTIGTQTWMAENLNYAYTDVPYKRLDYTSDSTSWCYKDDANNCSKYGRLYTWAAAMDSVGTWSTNGKGCGYNKTCSPTYPVRGVCPEGWHLPDSTEWATLFAAVGGLSIAGQKLKFATGWTTKSGITNEDAFAFSALPTGGRDYYGSYDGEGNYADFWSSTEDGSYNAYYMFLYYYYGGAHLGYNGKYDGFSVRCLKD